MTEIEKICRRLIEFYGLNKEGYDHLVTIDAKRLIIESVKLGYAEGLRESVKI